MKINKVLCISMILTILISSVIKSNAFFVEDSIGSSSENLDIGEDTVQDIKTEYQEINPSDSSYMPGKSVGVYATVAPSVNVSIDRNFQILDAVEDNTWRDWNANGIIEYGDLTDVENEKLEGIPDGKIDISDLWSIYDDGLFNLGLLTDQNKDGKLTVGEFEDLNGDGCLYQELECFLYNMMQEKEYGFSKRIQISINVVSEETGDGGALNWRYPVYIVTAELKVKNWSDAIIPKTDPKTRMILFSNSGTSILEARIENPKAGTYSGVFEITMQIEEAP